MSQPTIVFSTLLVLLLVTGFASSTSNTTQTCSKGETCFDVFVNEVKSTKTLSQLKKFVGDPHKKLEVLLRIILNDILRIAKCYHDCRTKNKEPDCLSKTLEALDGAKSKLDKTLTETGVKSLVKEVEAILDGIPKCNEKLKKSMETLKSLVKYIEESI